MNNASTLMTFFAATQILFAFAFGACTGSLINVLVYRMPRGLSVVRPASRCPSCDHLLTWRENIPVLGWVLLRGRCRFCRARISPEYPIVEAIVGLLFVAFYVLWYLVPARHAEWAGIDWATIRPEWALNGLGLTWPVFVMLMMLVGSLVAMTIIDARTFTIPLVLTWVPALVALAAHPGTAVALEWSGKRWRSVAPGEWWAIATPGAAGWPLLCAAFGALAGLAIANGLLALGLLRRSFDDYEAWEEEALRAAGKAPPAEGATPPETGAEGPSELAAAGAGEESAATDPRAPARRLVVAIGIVVAGVGGGIGAAGLGHSPILGSAAGVLAAVPLVGLVVRLAGLGRRAHAEEGEDETPAELWIQYPHARREVVREALFLAPCVTLAVVGWFVGQRVGGPWSIDPVTMDLVPARLIPLWLSVLGGVVLGYLVGGGIIWGIRILGTIAFGKEAMGLGDVHLLAAVGACLGWIDSVLAFFLAPFMALYIVLVQASWSGEGRKAMPYGPYLAAATVAVLLFKSGIESGLTALFGSPIPLNFP